MIKAVLVDDERPALRGLEYLLKRYSGISIIGIFTNPLTAIDEIGRLQPQVVFLDINMPQLRGIDAASLILESSPDTDIVFVTAFDEYAIEAFELHALDYILKPIAPERLQKTIDRLLQKKTKIQNNSTLKLQIKCLGRFQVVWENQEPIKWRTEKTRELFAFLLHNQGKDISKEEILDKIWPEDDPKKAIRQLYNGIYYIRKTLEAHGIDSALISINTNYNLKLGPVDLDVRRLYELQKYNYTDILDKLEEIEMLYTGDYFEGEDYPWAYFERERLGNIYEQCLVNLAQLYIEMGHFERAESKLIQAYARNPYEEMTTELLLKLYIKTGQKSKVMRHFKAYTELLKEELGIQPSENLAGLCKSMPNSSFT